MEGRYISLATIDTDAFMRNFSDQADGVRSQHIGSTKNRNRDLIIVKKKESDAHKNVPIISVTPAEQSSKQAEENIIRSTTQGTTGYKRGRKKELGRPAAIKKAKKTTKKVTDILTKKE